MRKSFPRLCLALAGATVVAVHAAPPAGATPPAIPVEAVGVRTGAVATELTAVGSLRADESVIIRPEIAGRVAAVAFDEGQRVTAGQLLLRLDGTIQQAELDQAQAALVLAERNAQRAKELFAKGAGTARSVDETAAELQAATAQVALSKARLSKTELRAPFAGVVGLRQVSVGDYVTPGQALVNLEDLDPVKAEFRLPETTLALLRPGQAIRVGVDAFPDRSFEGEVYAIDPRVDPEGRSVVLRARLPNPQHLLRPGLFARVTLVVDRNPNALLVPEQAVFPRGERQFVYRVLDSKAVLTAVRTGQRREGQIAILEGVSASDTVVTAGQMKLRDGASVQIIDSGAAR